MTAPRFTDARLAQAIADGEHSDGWVLEHDAAMAVLLDLRDARAELDAAPKVRCSCHPGVRWPSEEWGKRCAITAFRAQRDDALALTAMVTEALSLMRRVALPPHDVSGLSMWNLACAALAATADAEAWLREHDAEVRAEEREECARTCVMPPRGAVPFTWTAQQAAWTAAAILAGGRPK
jgi:hypothetical protein